MPNLDQIQEVLEKDMTRGEFLRYVGIAMLSIIGVSSIAQNVNKAIVVHKNGSAKNANGYGMSAYGR